MAKKGLTRYEFYLVTRDGDVIASFGQLPQAEWHRDVYESRSPGPVYEIHPVEVSRLGWAALGEVRIWVTPTLQVFKTPPNPGLSKELFVVDLEVDTFEAPWEV